MVRLVEFSDIDTNIFCTNQASGGDGGTSKEFLKLDKGAVMTKIQAWKQGWRIRGVEMWMSDGSSELFGERKGDSKTCSLASGEFLKDLYIQASHKEKHDHHRVGAISFSTSAGQSFKVAGNHLKDEDKYHYSMPNSGIVCGMFGKCGDDVDCLGFAILNPINFATLMDVVYPTLDTQTVASTPIVVVSEQFTNDTSVEQTYTLSGKKSVTIVRAWSVTTGFEMTEKVGVTAGIPEVGSVDESTSWTVSATTQFSRSSSVTEEQSWSWPIACPPHTTVLATGNMYQDDIDTEYKGKVHIGLQNGHSYEYEVTGIYNGLNSRKGDQEIEELGTA